MASDPGGWMPNVAQIRTPEYGYPDIPEDSMFPQAVIFHVMQGFQRTMIDWAKHGNGGKSAHFTIGRDGTIVQHVSIWDPAWHAGDVNAPTWRKYAGGNPNKYTIGIEQEGFGQEWWENGRQIHDYVYDDAHPWPDPLNESAREILRWFFHMTSEWLTPNLDTVISHSMTNGLSRKNDPGPKWMSQCRPWLISEVSAPSPPIAIDPVRSAAEQAHDILGTALGRP